MVNRTSTLLNMQSVLWSYVRWRLREINPKIKETSFLYQLTNNHSDDAVVILISTRHHGSNGVVDDSYDVKFILWSHSVDRFLQQLYDVLTDDPRRAETFRPSQKDTLLLRKWK